MEKALRYELSTRIPTIANSIYPTNAPETCTNPYLVYTRIGTSAVETLEGYTDNQELSYMFSCIATKYSDMKDLINNIVQILKSFSRTSIGEDGIYIEQVKIVNVTETWESQLRVNRGIIDFTIYF